LYELAKNPDVQRKLQEEIDEVLLTDLNTHELNYEKITSMKYLAACVRETLRKYPPIPLLFREASNDYQISGSKTVIEKGTSIVIPVHAIQNDPDYYPDPDEFIPERFLDGKSNENGVPYLSFGDGPRKCFGRYLLFPLKLSKIFYLDFPGMRMGYLSTKIGVVAMLSKFNVEMTEGLPQSLDFDPKQLVLSPTVLLNLKFSERS
jgi:cytochrome P450 family 6